MGVSWMCVGQIVSSLIALVINTYYTGKLIDLGFLKQMKDLIPAILYSFSMGAVVYVSTLLETAHITKVVVGILVGATYYIMISILTKSAEFNDLLSLLKLNKTK